MNNVRKYPELYDEAWLRCRIAQGLTQTEIAKQLDCPHTATVTKAFRRYGLQASPNKYTRHFPELQSRDWLGARWPQATSPQIAAELGCSQQAVLAALRRHGFETALGKRATIQVGEKYVNLTVLEVFKIDGRGRYMVRARCVCGVEIVRRARALQNGTTISCGCVRTLGQTNHEYMKTQGHPTPKWQTPTYITWKAMRTRCRDTERVSYQGVSCCTRWLSYDNFLADMGERPDGTTLDRIDVSGNYEPDNCRWATPAEQLRNRRKASSSDERYGDKGTERTGDVVYFVEAVGLDVVKIGCTCNLVRRLNWIKNHVQKAHPDVELLLLGAVPGYEDVEACFHRLFVEAELNATELNQLDLPGGEWFHAGLIRECEPWVLADVA